MRVSSRLWQITREEGYQATAQGLCTCSFKPCDRWEQSYRGYAFRVVCLGLGFGRGYCTCCGFCNNRVASISPIDAITGLKKQPNFLHCPWGCQEGHACIPILLSTRMLGTGSWVVKMGKMSHCTQSHPWSSLQSLLGHTHGPQYICLYQAFLFCDSTKHKTITNRRLGTGYQYMTS